MRTLLVATLLLAALALRAADETFPKPGWQDAPDPLASKQAVPGGEISYYLGPEPSSLNYYLETSTISATVFGLLYETLLDGNPVTLDDEPGLAERWSISEDKLTYTFWLDRRAKWSDGKPITANDVVWTFETVMKSPKTGPFKVDLERFDQVKAVDEFTVRWHAKEVHWSNLYTCAGLSILPQHVFADKKFEDLHTDFTVVSGPYQLKERREGLFLALAKRADWWGKGRARYQHKYNFATLKFRFFQEDDNAYEAFKKGEIDVFPVASARRWNKEAVGAPYDQAWIVKQRVHNYNPIGFQGFAMNIRRPQFRDVETRRALALLLNRQKMNETLMFNEYVMLTSYFQDLYSPALPCKNEELKFDKEAARALLGKAGWKANPATGLLEREGKPFTIKFLTRDSNSNRFLVIVKEDFKDVGIELTIDQKDWAAWIKDMDAFNFDMTWAAWSAGVRKDPENLWSSKEADRDGGQNITGFRNAAVDALIEKQKTNYDINQRHAMVREIDGILTQNFPYILLWYANYSRVLYWNKFGTPPTVFSKYGDPDSCLAYWWADEDSAADLKAAQEKNTALPKKPYDVKFDEVFKPAP